MIAEQEVIQRMPEVAAYYSRSPETSAFTVAGDAFDTRRAAFEAELMQGWQEARAMIFSPNPPDLEADARMFEASHCSVRPNDDLNDLARNE